MQQELNFYGLSKQGSNKMELLADLRGRLRTVEAALIHLIPQVIRCSRGREGVEVVDCEELVPSVKLERISVL